MQYLVPQKKIYTRAHGNILNQRGGTVLTLLLCDKEIERGALMQVSSVAQNVIQTTSYCVLR